MSLASAPATPARRPVPFAPSPLNLTGRCFDLIRQASTDAKADPLALSARRLSDEAAQAMEIFRQICSLDQFGDVSDYNEIHTNVMNELRGKIEGELKAGRTKTIILERMLFGTQAGTVATVAVSEAEWLAQCGAARVATDAEIAEARANSTRRQPSMKSWTRSNEIRNACKGVRSRERVK